MGNLMVRNVLSALFYVVLFTSCTFFGEHQTAPLFEKIPSRVSGVDFENRLHPDPSFNILNYLYYYDGAGVAVADINHDDLPDLFFVGNEGRHALYLNKGNFQFEEVTSQAGLGSDFSAEPISPLVSWATGAAFGDVNRDGYPDLFITYASALGLQKPHALFINQGDGTFVDQAEEWGINLETYGTQVAFLDYNLDGKEDLFLLNHSFHSERTYGPSEQLRKISDPKAGDRLFKNMGSRFEEVTEQAGIQNSALGYGLGVAISDLNLDGWPDIYVGNDFHENDYLYLNQGDGTFKELAESVFSYTSNSSMGNDIADLNNDGLPDIVSLDMMPFDRIVKAHSGGADPPLISQTKESFGFRIHANHNTLQIHRGMNDDNQPIFQEAGMAAGIAMTDWSWAVLAADFTNSGHKDLFITNGMVRRPNDLDFINSLNRLPSENRSLMRGGVTQKEYNLISQMPESRTSNKAFQNFGNLEFRSAEVEWGLDELDFSTGASWVDLDLDGDLDLIVSTINSPISIFRNTTRDRSPQTSHYLKLRLYPKTDHTALGTKAWIWTGDETQYAEFYQVRGFQSSSEPILHFGVGSATSIDSLKIRWPDGSEHSMWNIPVDTTLSLRQVDSTPNSSRAFAAQMYQKSYDPYADPQLVAELKVTDLREFLHTENQYAIYQQEPLVPYNISARGPAMAAADLDGDGVDEIFLGGSHLYSGKLIKETQPGKFKTLQDDVFAPMSRGEDRDALFFDADRDGDIDLYLARGGSEQSTGHPLLQDLLLLNNGDGQLEPALSQLPVVRGNASVVVESSSDPFLFVGSHAEAWSYGVPSRSSLLVLTESALERGWISPGPQEEYALWSEITELVSEELSFPGMVTDAFWADLTGDGKDELILVGEWMGIQIYQQQTSETGLPVFVQIQDQLGFSQSVGFWQSVHSFDVNGDSRPDLLTGNLGLNTILTPDKSRDVYLQIHDFTQNGVPSSVMTESDGKGEYVLDPLDELLAEYSFLAQRIESYKSFANTSFQALFPIHKDQFYQKIQLNEVRSGIWLSQPDGTYLFEPLPLLAQTTSIRDWILLDNSESISAQSSARNERSSQDQKNFSVLASGNLPFVRPSISAPQRGVALFHLQIETTQYSSQNGSQDTIQEQLISEIKVIEPGKALSSVKGVISNLSTIELEKGSYVLIGRNSETPLLLSRN